MFIRCFFHVLLPAVYMYLLSPEFGVASVLLNPRSLWHGPVNLSLSLWSSILQSSIMHFSNLQFFQILCMKLENQRGSKVTVLFFWKMRIFPKTCTMITKQTSNRVFQRFWNIFQYFLLEIVQNERSYDSLFSFAKHIPGQILVHKLQARMLSLNQIARFCDILDFCREIVTTER